VVRRNWIPSLLLAIVAVLLAWWLVGAVFSAAWFLIRLIVVLVVAVMVYLAISAWLGKSDRQD